jgi:cell division protein FtsB
MARVGKVTLYVIIAVIAAAFLPPFAKYQALRYKNHQLEEQIRQLKADQKRLLAEKMRLETDITYVEQKARERLGVVRKGEIVLKDAPKRK